MNYDCIVVGAGPSGLFAAIAAAECGEKVLVLEQLPRPGAKLLATGGGKCNLTNRLDPGEMSARFSEARRFVRPALHDWTPEMLRQWFTCRGVPLARVDGFHDFPRSERAADVLEALLAECRTLHVEIRTGETVRRLTGDRTAVTGVETAEAAAYAARRVIIACGGHGYPKLGGLGIGYQLARQAGHTVVTPRPAMTGLRTRESWPCELSGLSLPDATGFIDLPGERKNVCRGELLFTHGGISAFAVLDLAGRVSQLLAERTSIPVVLNLTPDRSEADWLAVFDRWQREAGTRPVAKLLAEILPARLATALAPECPASRFSGAERKQLAARLTRLPLEITGTEGWEKAMVTQGGVALDEVDPKTLASRLLPNLFFAGEVLDVTGPCGGFNLQWAFSSGRKAGAAVQRTKI